MDTPSDIDTPDSPAKDESVDIDPSDDGVEAFTAMYVRQAEEAKVPQDDLFQAYSNWTDQYDIDGTTKGWFTRKLRNVVDLDTDRSRVDGDRVQFYLGLTLTQEGYTLLDQGDGTDR